MSGFSQHMPTRAELKQNLKSLKETLKKRPMDLDARMRMARTYRLLKDKKNAVAHYRQVARYLSLAGQPLGAVAVLKELLQVDPKHEETLLFLAKLYARTRAADRSNTGRVAVPILDDDAPVNAMPGGMPMSATGIWRAIRPADPAELAVVHESDAIGAAIATAEGEALESVSGILDVDELGAIEVPASVDGLALSGEGRATALDAEPRADESHAPEDEHADDEEDTVEPPPLSRADTTDMRGKDHVEKRAAADAARAEADAQKDADDADAFTARLDELGVPSTDQNLLPTMPLLSSLSPSAFVELGRDMRFRAFDDGETVFKEGDPSGAFYVISGGRARVTQLDEDDEPIELATLGRGEFVGVLGLMSARDRVSTMTADGRLEVLEIDGDMITQLAGRHPDMREVLLDFYQERLLLNLIAGLPELSELSPMERFQVAAAFRRKSYDDDVDLVYEGATHNGVWVLLRGAVHLIDESDVDADGEFAVWARLGPTEAFGSLGASAEAPVDLTARAKEPTIVAMLTHRALTDLVKRFPNMAGLAEAFDAANLMLSMRLFAVTGRVPGMVAGVERLFAEADEPS